MVTCAVYRHLWATLLLYPLGLMPRTLRSRWASSPVQQTVECFQVNPQYLSKPTDVEILGSPSPCFCRVVEDPPVLGERLPSETFSVAYPGISRACSGPVGLFWKTLLSPSITRERIHGGIGVYCEPFTRTWRSFAVLAIQWHHVIVGVWCVIIPHPSFSGKL